MNINYKKIMLLFVMFLTLLQSACVFVSEEDTSSQDISDEWLDIMHYESYSQDSMIEEIVNTNPIDKCYSQDDLPLTTTEIVEFYGEYCGYWESEMDNALEIIEENVSKECWQTLKDSQLDWEKYIHEDVALFNSIYNEAMGNGSVISIFNSKKALLETRYRTLELIECCIIICGEYEFVF